MRNLRSRLKDFALGPAPLQALHQLPPPHPEIPDPLKGTRIEFMLRVMREGTELILSGDPEVEPNFTFDDIQTIYIDGVEPLIGIAFRNDMPEQAEVRLGDARDACLRVGRYHAQKQQQLECLMQGTERELKGMSAKFQHMISRGAYQELLTMYPYYAGARHLFDTAPPPAPDGSISLAAKRHQQTVLARFRNDFDTSVNSQAGLFAHMGAPAPIERLCEDLSDADKALGRLKQIGPGLHDVMDQLSAALSGQRQPRRDNVFALNFGFRKA